MDEALSVFIVAQQDMGRPHDLCQSPQVLSSALPCGCITVPEEQRSKDTKQERHGDRGWKRQITTEQGETEKRVRQTSRETGKIKKTSPEPGNKDRKPVNQ